MKRDTIQIKKSLIPYTFDILLANEVFNIGVKYNETADLFTIALKKDGVTICTGEPIVYGVPLFNSTYIADKYPKLRIVPYDESEERNKVTWENFNETVFLVVDNGSDEIGE